MSSIIKAIVDEALLLYFDKKLPRIIISGRTTETTTLLGRLCSEASKQQEQDQEKATLF